MTDGSFAANLEYYKVFYYVAKYGNITAAAEKLVLTQPSVTKSIQRLEEQLGCALFKRTKRGVSLTIEGELIWKRVEPACRLIQSAETELKTVRRLESGTLSIASTEMGFGTYVLPAMGDFLKEHPKVKVRFRNALTERVLEMLRTGAIDLAILYTPLEIDESLTTHTLDILRDCLVVGERYAHLAKGENDLAQLKDYPFITMPEGSSGKEFMKRCFQKYGLYFEPDIEVTTMELVIQAVSKSFGIGTLPEPVAQRAQEQGRLFRIPLKKPLPERRVLAVTNSAISTNTATSTFIENYLNPRAAACDWS